MKNKVPPYAFFRILVVSMVLYSLLMAPTTLYMLVKNYSTYITENSGLVTKGDSVKYPVDSVEFKINAGLHNHKVDINTEGENTVNLNFDPEADSSLPYIVFLLIFLLMAAVIGLNIPFKIYIKRTRKKRQVSAKLQSYCRKYLFRIPYINSGALLLALLLLNVDDEIMYFSSNSAVEQNIGLNMMITTMISSLLVALFTLFWQQHSIHYRNLEYFFDKSELYKRQKEASFFKMRGKFMLVQGITTLLPVSIIVFYIFLSMSRPSEIGISKVTEDQAKILVGGYSTIMNEILIENEGAHEDLASGLYINTVDMYMSGIGIIAGVLVTLIYIIFFVRWLTIQITSPVNNLLKNMEHASASKEYSYSIVRSNDEMGQLTEGYNIMAEKISNYIKEVEEINRGLEEKVKERTAEIMAQRDEIEAQRDEIEAQRDTVTIQKEQIENIHKEVTDSINYAKRIQIAKLPKKEDIYAILPDSFILFKPKDIVSGDFYFYQKYEQIVILAAADCTGHGVPGAFMSMIGSERLDDAVFQSKDTSEILRILNKGIKTSLQQSDSEESTRDGLDIALCSIDLQKRILKYAGANRPIWIMRKGKKEIEEIKANKTAIGGLTSDNQQFDTHEIVLNEGDSFYIFSDGYADTFDAEDRKLTTKGFKQILGEITHMSMCEQYKYLDEFIENWKKGTEQVDDILVIGVRL